ncbi:hypothetical protein AwDysgo_21820 [Bacteroidales bacterium]|nr:hypothetical protein AwDysgo_21820 [Bacteroidales bacterium]
MSAETKANGEVVVYDPQTGSIVDFEKDWGKRIRLDHGVKILRVDELEINAEIIAEVVKKSEETSS